jgi:RND family efflux transporter MFP subunit
MNARLQLRLGCLLIAIGSFAGCMKRPPEDNSTPSVTVQSPKQEAVTGYLDLSGTVSASRSVNLVARVVGYLESVNFQDGTFVDAGQLLFTIEPKPYEEQLALSQAQLDQAQSEYDRQLDLIKQNATSVSNVEKWKSSRDQAAAQVELDKINLGYTKVTAPFSGRIGRRLVDPGNLVGAGGATQLATLDQLLPIYVYFNLNEREALRLRDVMAKRGLKPFSEVGKAPVLVALQGEEGFPHEGILDFTDSSVSTSTGTLQLRAIFKNEDRALFPGVFVNVRIPLGEPTQMLVIPEEAIGNDQEGDYVLLVNADDVVQRRNVQKGTLTPSGRAIRSGLSAGDRVIVKGLQQARVGTKVKVSEPNSEAGAP